MDSKVKFHTEIQSSNIKNNLENQQPRMVQKKVVIYPHYSNTPSNKSTDSLIVTQYEDVTSQHITNNSSEEFSDIVEDFTITEVQLYDPENKKRLAPQGRRPGSSKYPQKFSCSICLRSFSQKFSCERHRFLIHGDRKMRHKFIVNSRQYQEHPEVETKIVSCKFTSKDTTYSPETLPPDPPNK